MGVKVVDWWTLLHFLFGVITTMSVSPRNPWFGILIGNIAHSYGEALEGNYRKGVLVESDRNHAGDMAAYLLGTFVGIYFTPFTIKHPIIRWILLVFLIVVTVQEFGREMWPDSWPFDPADTPFGWFGAVTALVDNDKK